MSDLLRRFRIVVPTVCCALLAVHAQEPTEHWKRQNTVDGRVEGFGFERDVAGGALTLVDFHAYRGPVDLENEIIVEFRAWQPRHARIVAREKSRVHGYYMEVDFPVTKGPHRRSYSTATVRTARKDPPIKIEHLGLVVRLGADKSDTYRADGQVAPVILRSSASSPLQDISNYSATFLPDTTVSAVSYSVVEGCEANAGTKPVDTGNFPLPQYKNNPFTISFQPGREGLTTLQITYQVDGNKHPPLTYCFWHTARPDAPGLSAHAARMATPHETLGNS